MNIFNCQWFRWISKTWHSIKSSWPNDLRIRELVMSWHPRTDMLLLWCPRWEHYLHEWLQVLLCNGVLVLFSWNLASIWAPHLALFFSEHHQSEVWTPPVTCLGWTRTWWIPCWTFCRWQPRTCWWDEQMGHSWMKLANHTGLEIRFKMMPRDTGFSIHLLLYGK